MARRGVRLILAVLLAVSTESGSVGGPQGTTLSEPGTREFGEGWRGAPEEVRLRGARACERARSVDSLGLRGPWCARLRGGQQESHQTDTDTKTQVLGEGVPFLTGLDEHLGRLAEEDEDDRPPENFPEDDCIEYRGHGVGEASSEPEVVLEEEEEDADVREATFLMQMGRSAPMEVRHPALAPLPHAPHTLCWNACFGNLSCTQHESQATQFPMSGSLSPKRITQPPCGWRSAARGLWKQTSRWEAGSARIAGEPLNPKPHT